MDGMNWAERGLLNLVRKALWIGGIWLVVRYGVLHFPAVQEAGRGFFRPICPTHHYDAYHSPLQPSDRGLRVITVVPLALPKKFLRRAGNSGSDGELWRKANDDVMRI